MSNFTNKERKIYQNICHLSERGVINYMTDLLTAKYGKDNVVATRAYVVAYGNIPVALVAHADTVFKTPPTIENFYYDQEKDVIWNPDGAGADDRAGIYSISYIVRSTRLRPHIIISTGEEVGCTGSIKLIGQMQTFPRDLKFLIQLDRRGKDDSVYYDCANLDFEEYINKFGFKTQYGTFTDISVLAPAWKVAAVNLSIGYEDEHNYIERLHVDWMYDTIGKVISILKSVDNDTPVFKYISFGYGYYGTAFYPAWADYDDDDDDDEIYLRYGYKKCYMCGRPIKDINLTPIRYPFSDDDYEFCPECFSQISHQVVWCNKCNRGTLLSQKEYDKILDKSNWTCEACKNGRKFSGDSASVQQSDRAQSERTGGSGKNGQTVPAVAGSEGEVHKNNGWSYL